MTSQGAGWYLRRLRRMTGSEVLDRARDSSRRRLWASRQVRPGEVAALPVGLAMDRTFDSPLRPGLREQIPPQLHAAVVAAADQVLAGEWTVLGATRTDSADPDWFLDPITGLRAPDAQLAFKVPHRDETVTGNVKQVWEMSRHHHLTVLAAAWWLTEDDRYAENVAAQLRSWWQANPFLSGVHWTSGIEAGIRLLSWVWIRRLLADWPKVGDLFEDNEDALRQIGWHQEFLAGFRSQGSSANNHVIAEAAGQFAAACAFDWYGERSAQWRAEAGALLESSFAANTFGSGLNRELATDYHRFVLELVLIAAVEGDAAGHPLSEGSWQRIARMLDAGVAILDVAGNPPRQGDGDEGRGLQLDPPEADPWAVALGGAAAVLGSEDWFPALPSSVQATLLAALAGAHRVSRMSARPDRFGDAGMVILRTKPEAGPEIWCRCDGGPHGFLSIAAHAHADALSLELRHDGVPLLVDPGTYCYHGEPEWRQYFRSTAAHNTLQLGGVDQSESGGPFLWTRHARSAILSCRLGESEQLWIAEHDGYSRLAAPAVHRRSVRLDPVQRQLTVEDSLRTAGDQTVRLSWHFGPDITVELDGSVAQLSWPAGDQRRTARMSLPPGLTWTLHRGQTDPVLGWYSPGFARRVPSSSLIGNGLCSSTRPLVSILDLP